MGAPREVSLPFSWETILYVLEHRLGMYVGRATYERAVAFVLGFDVAQPQSIDEQIRSRLQARGYTGPLFWASVLLREALGGELHAPVDLGGLTPEQDRQAIAFLVSELRAALGTEQPAEPEIPSL